MRRTHYWNRNNFEGLEALQSLFAGDPRLDSLVRYCELRERGMRKDAFAELRAFLRRASAWPSTARRDAVLRILDAHRRVPEAHQFLAEPLRRELIEPTLEEWCAAEPDNAVPVRELALLCRDETLLREALRRDPRDQVVRRLLVEHLAEWFDYAIHEVPAGVLSGVNFGQGASAEECRSLRREVEEFRELVRVAGLLPQYEQALGVWSHHFERYPEYLESQDRHESYAGYLEWWDSRRGTAQS